MHQVILIDDDPTHHFLADALIKHHKVFENYRSYIDPKVALIDLVDAYYGTGQLPDIILLDLNMPGVSGWEFLEMFENIRALINKDIKVFIVTSSIDPNDKAKSEFYSAVKGYYSKPLSSEILKAVASRSSEK
ncbi:response regulator [Desertivirga arenae]|uniref:response regulator n=1 Tax=Desertivirga arenae TaxID=2810309 RepID=UPI001A96B76A|nr:response regulator [Pedobacter sp. SYSU D00823]